LCVFSCCKFECVFPVINIIVSNILFLKDSLYLVCNILSFIFSLFIKYFHIYRKGLCSSLVVLFRYLYVTQVLRTRDGIDSHNIAGTPGNKEVATRLYTDLFETNTVLWHSTQYSHLVQSFHVFSTVTCLLLTVHG